MWQGILIAGGILAALVIVDISIRLYQTFHNRRCPHCGKKMEYLKSEGDDLYLFHCPHCGYTECVKTENLFEDQEW